MRHRLQLYSWQKSICWRCRWDLVGWWLVFSTSSPELSRWLGGNVHGAEIIPGVARGTPYILTAPGQSNRRPVRWKKYFWDRPRRAGIRRLTGREEIFLASAKWNFVQMPLILRDSWRMPLLSRIILHLLSFFAMHVWSYLTCRINFCVIWPLLIRVRVGNTLPVCTGTPSVCKRTPSVCKGKKEPLYAKKPPMYAKGTPLLGNSRNWADFEPGIPMGIPTIPDSRPRETPLWKFQVTSSETGPVGPELDG